MDVLMNDLDQQNDRSQVVLLENKENDENILENIDSPRNSQTPVSVISSSNSSIQESTVTNLIGEFRFSITEELNSIENDEILSDIDEEIQHQLNIKNQLKNFEKLSKEMEQNKAKWKKLEEQLSSLTAYDDSESELINRRINELQSMCSIVIRPEYIFDSLDPNLQQYVLSLVPVSKYEFEQEIRESWTSLDLFRYGVRMVNLISFIGKSHLRHPWWLETDVTEELETININEKPLIKYSINNELRMSLTTNPRFRSKSEIQQIACFNQTLEAFTDLFPTEMEMELARCISYEIYENNRVILYQNTVPNKLYYILMGKMEMIYVYKLIQGEVHRSMGFLSRNQMNNLTDFQNGVPSSTNFVARGQLEVLTLHKEDYLRLSNQTNIESIQIFLQKLTIFKGFPISESTLKSKMIKIQYYRNDKVISENSMNDPYFYVIKSGNVAVTRKQGVYENDVAHLWNSSNVYSLGCKREANHASTMLNVNDRQLEITSNNDEIDSLDSSQTKERSLIAFKPHHVKPHTSLGSRKSHHGDQCLPPETIGKSRTMIELKRDISFKQNSKVKSIVKIHNKKERITYVKIDTLKVLDVFGLEALEQEDSSPKPNLILISEGAEIILINKRYFLKHVNNNTLLEIRKLVKSYMSEEEAKHLIDDENKWKAYKKILMQKMVALHCS